MIDTTQSNAIRKAVKYLGKKEREKEARKNLITGLIFLAALILLVVWGGWS